MGAYSAAVVADGASHYWRLGEPSGTTAADSIAGGANAPGTISGGVTLGQAGPLADGSTAMLFNGTTGKVQTAAGLVTCAPDLTLEAWIKTTAGRGTQRALVSGRTGGFTGVNYLGLSITGTGFFYKNGPAPSGLTGARVIDDGVWHHLVGVTTAAGTSLLYVDGVADGTGANPATGPETGQVLLGFDGTEGVGTQGAIAEVAVYPLALSPAQIATHYALRTATAGGGAPAFPWLAALVLPY
jgi:hypothetical protein